MIPLRGAVVGVFNKILLPKSNDVDFARREFILNVLLFASITLLFFSIVLHLVVLLFNLLGPEAYRNNALSIGILFAVLSFFVSLYILSCKGFFRLASFLFLGVFFLFVAYMNYRWGVDLPSTILLDALIIIMSGILISTRFAFVTTAIIAVTMTTVDFLQRTHIVEMNRYWRNEPWTQTDTIVTIVIFLVIATVSWLSNREIEKSLMRARRSEADLKKERDLLEITVEDRTKELKETQAEKIIQLYRFAEFGRLSSGLFHDLVSPLTAVSLNIEKIKNTEDMRTHVKIIGEKTGAVPIAEVSGYVDKAIVAARKMEDMVSAVRRQLARQENKTLFSLHREIEQVIEVLSYKALKANVMIHFSNSNDIKTFGDAIKFNQIVLNLVTNAIDTCEGLPDKVGRKVNVSFTRENNFAILTVRDNGVGISENDKPKLFEPFFTTKSEKGGIGIGLSMVKRFTEKDFGGSIEVKSKENQGSEFVARFPVSS